MAFAASVKPFGISTNAFAVSLATNGMAQMLNGMIAAVVPNVVFNTKRVNGNKIINKIINGIERPILMMIFSIRLRREFCRISPLPEALPTLINGITLTLVTLVGYSAMAGIVGGGGLGSLAINYGEYRNMVYVKWIATIIIVVFVMISQKLGDDLAKRVDHR